MKRQLRTHIAAAMLLAPAAMTMLAQPAVAQSRVAAPQVHALSVNADNGLQPGSDLQFALEATPGARASIAIGKSNIVVPLKQTSAGMYRGTYTVRRADRIDPTGLLTARVTRGKLTVAHSFSWPQSFQALAMGGPPAVAAAPRIERFVIANGERMEPGRELRFRLSGLPGASATFEIPGIVSGVPMREVSPGQYVGTYTIRQRDNLDAFNTAIATLRSGNQWVTSRVDRVIQRDNRAPEIANVTPRHGAVITDVGRVLIAGSFEDREGRGVNPDTVRLRVDGRDVTDDARITPDRFEYRADLPPGRYTADVSARDRAGNHVSQSWSFEVASQQGNYPGGRLPLSLSSPSNNATVDANGNVFVQGRTAPYASVSVKVDSISPVMGNRVGVAQTVATETVQADRSGFFSLNLSPRGGIPLPGSRYDVQVTANQGSQTAESRITLFQRS